jgi:hypothetical protein
MNTGYGNTMAQVNDLYIPSPNTLRDYHRAVVGEMIKFLGNITEADLDKEYPFSIKPGEKMVLGLRLVSSINDFQHIGQAGYVRGIVSGQGWYGR